MAAITTLAAGFWDVTGTWTGGVIPGNGDTVTLNHAVSVRDARTVGVSPPTGDPTNAIRVNAMLTLTGAATLVSRGDIGLNSAALAMQAGAILELDASAAASPSTTNYVCGSINATAGAGFPTISGSAGTRCTVRSNAGGGYGRFVPNDNSPFVADYCDFQSIGSGSVAAIEGWANTGQSFHLGNCTFDSNCGPIGNKFGSGHVGDAIVELINVTHRGAASVGLPAGTFSAGGVRTVSGCRFTGLCTFFRIDGYDFSDTTFEANYDATGGPWKSWDNCMLAIPQADIGDWGAFGDMSNTYVIRVGNPNNPHGVTTVDGQSFNFKGLIFDMPDGTFGNGDMITFNNSTNPCTIAVTRCILLKSGTDVPAGTLISCLGGANTSVIAEHNTYYSDDPSAAAGIYLGETFIGFAGMLVSCHSNIAWNKTANKASLISCDVGVATDVVFAAAAHHNGKWNSGGNNGYSATLAFSTAVGPGLNDVWGDPGFVDKERTIKSWDTLLGGAGTVANALTELRKKNDAAGYNSAYTIAALTAYIRAGFVPSNQAYLRGGPDSSTIGAIQVDTFLTTPRGRVPRNQRG